jgi:hypothetical protein
MTRSRIAALGALVALAAGTSLVRAQEDAGVKLEYKWKAGQVFRYRVTAGGTINTKMEGLPAPAGAPPPPGSIPMELQMTIEMSQRVKEVAPDGSATLTQQLETMNMTNKVMGQQMLSKFENGKFTMTMNGQPMQMPPGARGDSMNLAGKPVDIKLTRRGQVLAVEGAGREALARMFQGTNLGQVFGAGTPGAGMTILPEAPVKVGQNWNDKQMVTLPIPIPGPPGAAPTALQINYTVQNTLTGLEGAGAERVAVIATKADVTMPETKLNVPADPQKPGAATLPMGFRDFSQKVEGTVRFDPEAGFVRSGDYNVNLGMKMDLPFPPPGGAAGGAKPQMAMDGKVTMKVALLPEGKAAPAPAGQ